MTVLVWIALTQTTMAATPQEVLTTLMSRIGQLENVVTGQQQLLQAASERGDKQQQALQMTVDQSQQAMALMQTGFAQQSTDFQTQMTQVMEQIQKQNVTDFQTSMQLMSDRLQQQHISSMGQFAAMMPGVAAAPPPAATPQLQAQPSAQPGMQAPDPPVGSL